ncbi:MAG: GGDEF domain-containing protein [Candidatus Eremiobacteraeota bacterium]|nr:GGDEF domain-containing protein [Candidatus Eremiobacteraeota bacterium]
MDQVTHTVDPRDYRAGSTLYDVAHGDLQLATGPGRTRTSPSKTRAAPTAWPRWSPATSSGARSMPTTRRPPTLPRTSSAYSWISRPRPPSPSRTRASYEETRRLLEETSRLALTDSPTGIPNRRALNEMLDRELHTSERYDTPSAFLILDLDDLKKINYSGGHSLGDLALKHFAQVLKKNARKGDIIARYAVDEFVLVMAQSDRTQTEHGVERILAALRRNGIASSIGVAMFPPDGTDGQTLFFSADEALYQAKQGGKNQYRFFLGKAATGSSTG